MGKRNESLGPFGRHANDYFDFNLSIIPCDGKRAKVSWKMYQDEKPSLGVFNNWLEKHNNANIGLITGHLNKIIVVDCDDPNRSIDSLEKEYGQTPVIVETPRGGKHLYYRYNGESSMNGFLPKIDIKADGGYVIAPYSINTSDNKSYRFIKGSIEKISDLTPSTHKSLPKHRSVGKINPPKKSLRNECLKEGARNEGLFKFVKNNANKFSTHEELLAFAKDQNQKICKPPLSNKEVNSIFASILKYKDEGRLWIKGERNIILSIDKFDSLCVRPRALVLYLLLLKNHKNNNKDFTIIQSGVARILGCDPRTISLSIKDLIQMKLIKRVHKSRGKSDAHKYSFC